MADDDALVPGQLILEGVSIDAGGFLRMGDLPVTEPPVPLPDAPPVPLPDAPPAVPFCRTCKVGRDGAIIIFEVGTPPPPNPDGPTLRLFIPAAAMIYSREATQKPKSRSQTWDITSLPSTTAAKGVR
jgi:hypothetical protein